MTPVIFKKDSDGTVFAAFPRIAGNMNPQTMTVYARVGQHSSADADYVRRAKPADEIEYADLFDHLKWVGYDDMVIRRRLSLADYVERRKQTEGRS